MHDLKKKLYEMADIFTDTSNE